MIIQAHLSNGGHARCSRERLQPREIAGPFCLVRMHPHRRRHIGVPRCQCKSFLTCGFILSGSDDVHHAGAGRSREHCIEIQSIRLAVEMRMGVDERMCHETGASASMRGKSAGGISVRMPGVSAPHRRDLSHGAPGMPFCPSDFHMTSPVAGMNG